MVMNRSTIQSICSNYYAESDKLTRHYKLSERAIARVALHTSFEDEKGDEVVVPRILARVVLRKLETHVDEDPPSTVGGAETILSSTYMEFDELRSDEILAYVDVVKTVEAWNKNELEDLPPSTVIDPGERPRRLRRYRR